MQRRRVVRFSRALLAALVASLGLFAVTIAAPPAAQAQEPVALASITLTSITPALPERDGTVTLAGRVTNISTEPLFRLQAIFWRNQAPILGREGIDQALASASNEPIGARLFDRDFQDLYTPDDPYLPPDASVDFSLTVQVADLELSPTDGIYLLGVHVLQNGNATAIGRTRVMVPVLTEPPDQALRMTSVVVLSSRPSLVRPGVLSDDHLAGEIGPRGRLTALLAAADQDGTSFAVDPALIDELETMQDGYQVLAGDGGSGQAAAERWLDAFGELVKERDGYRLLYGSPDIAALVRTNQTAVLKAAETAGTAVETTRSLPLLVLPARGLANEATVDAAEDLNPAAILLADSSAAATSPLLAGPGKAPVVSFGSAAFGVAPGPDPRNTTVQLQEQMLADTWAEASAVADDATHGRVRLVTSAAQATGVAGGVDAPWLERSTLSDLLRMTPATWDQDFHYPASARAGELKRAQLDRLRRFSLSQRTYDDLLLDTDSTRAAADAAAARAASSAWRNQIIEQDAWLDPQQDDLDAALLDRIEISSAPRVRTVAREGVSFPITIKNLLPRSDSDPDANAVRVRLEFTSDNTQRLTISPIEADKIRAGENFTANANVTARANGTVPVTAQLFTDSGLKVGRPVTINVQVTQNGTTGWVIAIAAGIVLAGTTALRIRQVTRERAKDAAAAGPIDALSSAPPTDLPPGGDQSTYERDA